MNCPKCGSEQTQRFKVIFENGTQETNTTGFIAGTGIGAAVGIGGAATKTSGTSQSLMAQRTAPPAKKSLKWPVIFLVIGLILLGVDKSLSWLPLLAGGAFAFLALKYNAKKWPGLYRNWLESWHCNKCGETYLQA